MRPLFAALSKVAGEVKVMGLVLPSWLHRLELKLLAQGSGGRGRGGIVLLPSLFLLSPFLLSTQSLLLLNVRLYLKDSGIQVIKLSVWCLRGPFLPLLNIYYLLSLCQSPWWLLHKQVLIPVSKLFFRECPGSPVVRNWHFHCQGPGLIPGQGTKISWVLCHSQKKSL